MDIQEKLTLSPLLAGLPLKSADVTEKRFREGQIISDRPGGTPAVGLVVSGQIDAFSVALDGKDVQLNSLTAGDCFGVCNLLADTELETVLRCAQSSEVLYISKPTLLQLMHDDVAFAIRYATLCNQKLQFLLHRIELLTMQSCRGRIIAFLLEKQDAVHQIHLSGSREDFARQLGVSRAALFRELSALQRCRAICTEGDIIRILDETMLEDFLYHPSDPS